MTDQPSTPAHVEVSRGTEGAVEQIARNMQAAFAAFPTVEEWFDRWRQLNQALPSATDVIGEKDDQ